MAIPSSASRNAQPRFGITLAMYPSTDTRFAIDLQRSSSGSTFLSVARLGNKLGTREVQYLDPLPADGGTRTYRARHVLEGYSAGEWTASVTGVPSDLVPVPLEAEGRRRVDTFFADNTVLLGMVSQSEGGEHAPLLSGYQTGSVNGGEVSTGTWVDGPAVSFDPPFANPPAIRLYPEQGVVFVQPAASAWTSTAVFASTAAQLVELRAVNLTATGFTPRARLAIRTGGLTNRTANFSTSNSLDAVGEASTATPANAPSYNDQYRAHYRVDMTLDALGGGQSVTAVVAVDTNTTGGFIQRSAKTYSVSLATTASTASWVHETQDVAVADVGSTDKVRVRFKSLTIKPGSTADVTVTIHAFDGSTADPSAGVTYQTQSTAVTYAPMCVSTADTVTWTAFSPGGST